MRSEACSSACFPFWRGKDTLVFLGDYIDRGPDSKGCIEEILRLRRDAVFSVVPLLGNHEAWMLASMDDLIVGQKRQRPTSGD